MMILTSENLVNDSTKVMFTIEGDKGEAQQVLDIGDALTDNVRYASYVEYSETEEEPYYVILVDKEASKIFVEDYYELS